MICIGCKYYDNSVDCCNADENCYQVGYQNGKVDAIDEMIRILKYDWKYVNKNSVIATHLIIEYEQKLEQLKEQTNE